MTMPSPLAAGARGLFTLSRMPMFDEPLTAIVAQLDVDLPAVEREVRAQTPSASDAAILDLALQRAIARLHVQLTGDDVRRVRSYMLRVRAEAAATREASARARVERAMETEGRLSDASARRLDPFFWQPPFDAREFVDAEGRLWRVHEVPADRVPGARGSHCLIFSTTDTLRRIWSYPADWRTLPDSALAVLSGGGAAPLGRAD
jgi:hypothetical protein